jgi:hypothetical protein
VRVGGWGGGGGGGEEQTCSDERQGSKYACCKMLEGEAIEEGRKLRCRAACHKGRLGHQGRGTQWQSIDKRYFTA